MTYKEELNILKQKIDKIKTKLDEVLNQCVVIKDTEYDQGFAFGREELSNEILDILNERD